ncbi:hypothetical protein V475_06340 [Sphingobium baderi LL03]|nr:hypothetical protein V475_06340 [Sphingobium baderi LL03]
MAKARTRLALAERALNELGQCQHAGEFADIWYRVLVAIKNTYNVLNKGAQASPQSRQWFGAKKEERRKDPLLQYLYQARDADEHGIDAITAMTPGKIEFVSANAGESHVVEMTHNLLGTGGSFVVKSADGKPVHVRAQLPMMKLSTVVGRGGVKFPPPVIHKGKIFEPNTPYHVAKLAIAHWWEVIDQAEALS